MYRMGTVQKVDVFMKKSVKITPIESLVPEPVIVSRYQWLVYSSAFFLLSIITFALYWKTLSYDFQFDDLANISRLFEIRHNTLKSLIFSGTRWISYWLNALLYHFCHFNPWGYRLVDVAIHCANGLLIFSLLFSCLSKVKDGWFKQHALPLAWLTALLFLIHPVQTQTVCYVIQGQLEGMATLSILLILQCLVWYAFAPSSIVQAISFSIAIVIAIIATGTKEIAILTPILAFLWDWFFIAQGSWSSLRKRFLFHGIITGLIWLSYLYLLKPDFFIEVFGLSVTAANNQGNVITAAAGQIITPFYWLISQCKVLLHYLHIFIWPFSISIDYDWKLVHSLFALDFIIPAALLVFVAIILWYILSRNKSSLIAVGFLWFFISMAPRTSIIPSAELMADYKTYLGSLGLLFALSIAIVFAYNYICSKITSPRLKKPVAQGAIVALVLIPLSIGTLMRVTVWSSGLAFWEDVMMKAPGKARGYNNYGAELSNRDRYQESISYFEKAIELDRLYIDPINNIAVSYSHVGEIDKAITALEKSLKLNPLFPEGYNNIAAMYRKKGDLENAEKALLNAVKLRPYYGKAWYNLGLLYIDQGKKEQAWESFKNCCYKADLDDDTGFLAFGKSSIELERYDDAIEAYHRLLKIQPRNEEAMFNLGYAYVHTKQYDKALYLYNMLNKAHPDDPRLIINIGQTYYEKGEPANALVYFEQLSCEKEHIPSICIYLARCYQALGSNTQARAALKELYALNPGTRVKKQADQIWATLT